MRDSDRRLDDLRFCLVGPGRVGASLARWAVARGARMQQVAGRRRPRAAALARALGGRAVGLDELTSEGCELLLLAPSDAALTAVARRLAGRPQAGVALHVAGAVGASVLSALTSGGSAVGSLHPLRAFPGVLADVALARGTLFAIDGDAAAKQLARRLATAWEGVAVEVPEESRALYHLAATLAAGGVVTLLAAAREIAHQAGLPPAVARAYIDLAQGALARAQEAGDPARAITGPAARGDRPALVAQLRALDAACPHLSGLVAILAYHALRLGGSGEPPSGAFAGLLAELARIGVNPHEIRGFLDR